MTVLFELIHTFNLFSALCCLYSHVDILGSLITLSVEATK